MRHKQRNYSTLSKETRTKKNCGRNKNIPFQKANKRGHKSITQLLLDKETDTSPCNENKETSLHKASERGLESIVFFLFDQGADINFLTIRNKVLYI